MSWGTLSGTPTTNMPFSIGDMTITATAWNSNIAGVPSWLLLILAMAVATMRTLRLHGSRVPRLLTLALSAYGLFHSAAWFLILATGGSSEPGIGSFITAGCFLAFVVIELRADSSTSSDRASRFRRRRHRRHTGVGG